MSFEPDDRLLRFSLRGNATFSILCAVVALAYAAPLAQTLGVPSPALLTALGVQLLAFAGLLLVLASRPAIPLRLAWAVVAADVLWVVGTIPLVLGETLTRTGVWTAIGIADVVAIFAFLQALGIRRASRATLPAQSVPA